MRISVEDDTRETRKEFFGDLHKIDVTENAKINIYSSDGARRGIYFEGKLVCGTKVKVGVKRFNNVKTEGKDEVE